MDDEPCTYCHQPTSHRTLDQHGSRPLCGMCMGVVIGDITRAGEPLTLVLPSALPAWVLAVANRGWGAR